MRRRGALLWTQTAANRYEHAAAAISNSGTKLSRMDAFTNDQRSRRGLATAAVLAGLLLAASATHADYAPPPGLPRYDLDIHIDVHRHVVTVVQRVLWTNRHDRPAKRILFNNHTHYRVPDADIGLLAKTLEILRLAPSEALILGDPPCTVTSVGIIDKRQKALYPLPFSYLPENDTALVVDLPQPLGKGQSIELELRFVLRLPQRQGRWGQWRGVTFLAQWLPVVAYYDDRGWHPAPFVPWHQPFYNEAGIYRAAITVPTDQIVGCSGSIESEIALPNGWKQIRVGEVIVRDFAVFCSKHYREARSEVNGIQLRCLYLPGHEFYGKEMLRIAAEAIPIYSRWFGPFPYRNFTVVESFFGWNGNECGGLVMIDSRIFGLPHMARNYADSLLTHEICHQWWYNVVGTNGYAETWMDEAPATHFSHKVMDLKLGKNNPILEYPYLLRWLPNIYRDDFRNYGVYGAVARGEATATVVPKMSDYGHLITLTAMNYDRGSRILGMIEDRLGSAGMIEFMRRVYRKYYFRVLHIADFRRELEQFTGQSWQEFFDHWLYGPGMTDWRIERVTLEPAASHGGFRGRLLQRLLPKAGAAVVAALPGAQAHPWRVSVMLKQQGDYTEPTVLGVALHDQERYDIRVPIVPGVPQLRLPEFDSIVETLDDRRIRVTLTLPHPPVQISVDPDAVLLDREPANNHWKTPIRVRATPVYFFLDETDVTTAYDRPNLIFGPWIYGSTFNNPWFTRSPLVGFRAGLYRTQQYSLGAYLAYRTNDRNIVAGVDGLIDHFLHPRIQVGFNAEQSLATLDDDETACSRAAVFARYVILYGSSFYLPPFEYVEAYGAAQNRCLPTPVRTTPEAKLFEEQYSVGVHYHKYYLTPYWDPEGGVALDVTGVAGIPIFGQREDFQQVFGQIATVKYMPDPLGMLKHGPIGRYLASTRWAFRLYAAAALPDEGQFFSLGGGDLFRGFDLDDRQGSVVWLASVEWRLPLATGLQKDFFDHMAGLRNIYVALFYDVGNAYLNGRQVGPTAQAVGAGLRLDVVWLGLIERTMLRFDFAQALDSNTPLQFWFGIQHPF